MDKSFQLNNATDSTQLNGAADKLTAKSKSKTKVKSDNHVNNDNQVDSNTQPELFKSDLDIVNTIIPDDENIDYNTLIELSIVKTSDKARTSDTNDDADIPKVLEELTESNSDSILNMPDTTVITGEPSSLSSFNTLTTDSETNEDDNSTEPNVLTESDEPKATPVSTKMIDADFDELSREYLQVTSLGEKKPVCLPLELRDALDAIARLSGDRKLSASHVAINVIRTFLNKHRELINRKLAGVKLSI